MPVHPDHEIRMRRALLALDGLSVGDAFGERFFGQPAIVEARIAQRVVPEGPWLTTDDTEMALGIVEVLDRHGRVDQDALAAVFGRRYLADPRRGYGGTAHGILQSLGLGASWRAISPAVFGGAGSMGNGGAMRVAPLGAYFADDLDAVVREAVASAEVTHAHPDGQAGAVAVAVAAAIAARMGDGKMARSGPSLLQVAYEATPEGETRAGLARALSIPLDYAIETAASVLGTGYRVLSWDTVPFALWCAARHIDDWVEALWSTVAGLGDRDTTCAVVGGVVVLAHGQEAIPAAWREAREALGLHEERAGRRAGGGG